MKPEVSKGDADEPRAFVTTRWSLIMSAANGESPEEKGRDARFVSWDGWMAEGPSQFSISPQSLESLPPEQVFDLGWAVTVAERALLRLREECESKGRLRLFHVLSSYLAAERDEVSYANLSKELGVNEAAVKKQLHVMRQRYRSLLRSEVARTVSNPAEVEDEIRHLCAALAAASE